MCSTPFSFPFIIIEFIWALENVFSVMISDDLGPKLMISFVAFS